MTEKDLSQIAEAIEKRDASAEEQLAQYFQEHWLKSLWSMAKRYGIRREEDVAEISQETFSILLTALRAGKYRKTSSLSTFLFGICKNVCRRWQRELRRQVTYPEQHADFDTNQFLETLQIQVREFFRSRFLHTSPLEHLTAQERVDIIRHCIQRLRRQDYRNLFELLLQDHDRNEISLILQLPVKRIDEMLWYGKQLLRPCVEQHLGIRSSE